MTEDEFEQERIVGLQVISVEMNGLQYCNFVELVKRWEGEHGESPLTDSLKNLKAVRIA